MTEKQLERAFVRWANSLDIRAFKGATANMKGFLTASYIYRTVWDGLC